MELIRPYDMKDSINEFSILLTDKIANMHKANVICPFSLLTAMNLVYRGSNGSTEKEIRDSLKFINKNHTFDYFKDLFSKLSNVTKISNCIFINANESNIKDSFKKIIGEIGTADNFDPADRVNEIKRINKYISSSTNNQINEILKENDPLEYHSLLINCIYFNSEWEYKFNRTHSKRMPFFGSEIREQKFMILNGSSNMYYVDDNYQYLEKSFSDKETVMGFVLPKARDKMAYINNDIYNIIKKMYKRRIDDLSIPKFKQSSSYQVKKLFVNLGIKKLFTDADMRDMTDDNIFVSDIIHKAVIEIDEDGVEASATTAVKYTRSFSSNKDYVGFVCNHPFAYYIRHKPTNTILFTGIYQ